MNLLRLGRGGGGVPMGREKNPLLFFFVCVGGGGGGGGVPRSFHVTP